jgi:hypothetical protein
MRLPQSFLIAISVVFIYSLSYAQGLNNDHPIDTTDIQNALDMLGVKVFKFPVDPPPRPCYVDFIVEYYKDTTLENTQDMLTQLSQETFSSSAPRTDSTRDWARIYCYDKTPLSWLLNIKWKDLGNGLEFNSDSVTVSMSDYRAFDYTQPEIDKKVPLIVRYSAKSGTNMMHCPGNLPVRDIIRTYAETVVVYMKLVPIEKK